MGTAAVKVLLDSQEKTYRLALNAVSEQMNSRISSLEQTVKELTGSLEFSQAEVIELKNGVKTLHKFKTDSQSDSYTTRTRIMDMEKRATKLPRRLFSTQQPPLQWSEGTKRW